MQVTATLRRRIQVTAQLKSVIAGDPDLSTATCQELNDGLDFGQKSCIYPLVEMHSRSADTSFELEDTGARTTGDEFDMFTLPATNSFGNTSRFTDSEGGQEYGTGSNGSLTDYVLDNAQSNADGTVLAVLDSFIDVDINWEDAMDAASAATNLGFTDWFLGSAEQFWKFRFNNEAGSLRPFNYPPFNFSAGAIQFWTSETNLDSTSGAYVFRGDILTVGGKSGTFDKRYVLMRIHTL